MSRVPFPIRGEYPLRRSDHQRSILFNHHWNSARIAGPRREPLEQLENFEASGKFDELERAVIRYAQAVTLRNEVSDATWSDLALRVIRRSIAPPLSMATDVLASWRNECVEGVPVQFTPIADRAIGRDAGITNENQDCRRELQPLKSDSRLRHRLAARTTTARPLPQRSSNDAGRTAAFDPGCVKKRSIVVLIAWAMAQARIRRIGAAKFR